MKEKVVLFYPSFTGSGKYHWAPFPYIYLGPFLEKEGFEVRVIDARVDSQWRIVLKRALDGALCLGVTSMTGPDYNDAVEATRIAKAIDSWFPVIWGGPQATDQTSLIADIASVDVVVRGQGEIVLREFVQRLAAGKPYNDLKGIVYKHGGVVYENKPAEPIPFDYDIFEGWHLLDIEKYRSPNNIVAIFTARGCPFSCTFCTTGAKSYSERSFEQVQRQVLYVVNDLKFDNIFIQDGTYFFNKDRVLKIARWFVDVNLNIKWKAKARANTLFIYSDEEMRLLKKSGLVSIFFGMESGSDKVLKNMNKNIKSQDAERSAKICRSHGIEFYASYMFATPYETVEDLKATIESMRRIKQVNPDAVIQNCIYLPLPGTPMYEQARACGFVPHLTIEEWGNRKVATHFDSKDLVTWIPEDILQEYIKVYSQEFTGYKNLWERELDGSYKSVFNSPSGSEMEAEG
ncbi:MAG: radical SAM protein [Candidatus Omnitrophota bacterium]|nr:radical SAM protein [Candidatus Omnitrophota bacterium]